MIATKQSTPSTGTASPLDELRDALTRALTPRDDILPSQWATANLRLSRHVEAGGGPFNIEDNPFLVAYIDALLDREVFEVTIKKSTQVGGTLTMLAMLIAVSELDPSPSMILTPDLTSAIELRDRIYFNMMESPNLREKVPAEKDWNNRHIDLESCRVYIAWAGSAQRTRGRPCKRVFRTEVDVYPSKALRGGDPMKSSSQRVKRFFWSQLINESSPLGEDSIVCERWEQSNQQHWWCQCPQCNKWQVLRFFMKAGEETGGVAGYKDSNGELLPIEEALRQCHYVCVSGCRWNTVEKNKAVKAGQWLPAGQWIDDQGEVQGTPRRNRSHLGFHLWSMHSPTISIGKVVQAYLEAVESGSLRNFFEDWLGLRFRSARKVPTWLKLGRHCAGDYERNMVPPQCYFLTAGIDVQQDEVWYVIRGWGPGKTSWLIDYDHLRRFDVETTISSDLEQLRTAVIMRKFPVIGGKSPYGKSHMGVFLTGIDANYRTREVHDWLRHHDWPESRVRAVRGDHKVDPREKFRRTVVEKAQRSGEEYQGGLALHGIFTAAYKDDRLERWQLSPGAQGFMWLPEGITRWGKTYLQQVVNEAPRDEVDKQGRKRRVWAVSSDRIGNHLGDTEVYAAACADMLLAELGMGWRAEDWVKDEDQQAPLPEISVVARDYLER